MTPTLWRGRESRNSRQRGLATEALARENTIQALANALEIMGIPWESLLALFNSDPPSPP